MIKFNELIKNNFDKASQSYDSVAFVQRKSADFLVKKLLERLTDIPKNILDIGTGTGYISRILLKKFPSSAYLLNDISAEMLEICRSTFFYQDNFDFLQSDMEKLPDKFYELVISNLALQWSDHLEELIKKFSANANTFAFSTLLDGTFQTWKDMVNCYDKIIFKKHPTAKELLNHCNAIKGDSHFVHWVKCVPITWDNPLLFMRYLKKLGAAADLQRVSVRSLRTLLKANNRSLTVDYKIFFGIFIRRE